jgi:serine/threonine protein kinase
MPPESFIVYGEKDSVEDNRYKADIYAAGIVLFNLLTGCMPYSSATTDNSLYLKFERERESFWEYHEKYSFERKVETELKELIGGMLESSPLKRWPINDIQNNAWYNGQCASPIKVTKEMRKRSSSIYLAKLYPEKRLEITKTWTAKSKSRKIRSKSTNESSYENMGMLLWRICSTLFGQ